MAQDIKGELKTLFDSCKSKHTILFVMHNLYNMVHELGENRIMEVQREECNLQFEEYRKRISRQEQAEP